MRKQKSKKMQTKILTGFGAALALVAGNLAVADTAKPVLKNTPPLAHSSNLVINRADLCKIGDQSCMLSKPYVKNLSDAQKKELQVLIGKGVQTDIKDACLVC